MTRLAVPYKAKDSPTLQSEFSHPDIAIALTCLTYYYAGLDDQALFESMELLILSDNADLEYQAWVHTAPSLPETYKHLQGINLKDRRQCTSAIFPHLRYSKGTIDYYLSRVVFPKECKEFPHKLSASGWDLGKKKTYPTTGFSGTNDSRYVLPLGISQLDLPEQSHTNALVLAHLLRTENSVALMTEDMDRASFDGHSLLALLQGASSKPRVILDLGAQIIDLTNVEMARLWLGHYEADEQTQAVVYFNDLDETMVLDKSGKIEELQTSPFSDQLKQCLIFIDEAHTRGTDLRFPAEYQAAVTLGAHVTKDRLVQACMRMRRLGNGQSVLFCVPREIECDIRRDIRLTHGEGRARLPAITVSDILCWAIKETCSDLRRAVPLWLNQGLRFTAQQPLWDEITNQNDSVSRLHCARQFREIDSQTLHMRYGSRGSSHEVFSSIDRVNPVAAAAFRKRCEDFGVANVREISFNEEQERELAPESEQQRQLEPPAHVEPAEHLIHPGLEDFVVKGIYPRDPLIPAFQSLGNTSAARYLDTSEFPHDILATRDFAETVDGAFDPDTYQRPVQWILTTRANADILVIVSPYEVQQLLPAIERSSHVTLHLYSPWTNVNFQPIDSLDLFVLPRPKTRQQLPQRTISSLNLFSGQLYLASFAEYLQLCEILGFSAEATTDEVVLGPDGFILRGLDKSKPANKSGFSKSPAAFLKVLMTKIRSDTENIEKTHIGRILDGIRLLGRDFA
jgi:hypothetical protein